MVSKPKKASSISLTAKKELMVFGVNKHLIDEMEAFGAKISYVLAGGGGVFKVSSTDESVGGSVPVSGQVMTLIKIGKLGPASKQAIQYQIEGYMNKVIVYEKSLKTVEPWTVGYYDGNDASTAKWSPVQSVDNVGGNMSTSTVALKDATKVLEKVSGTSPGSVYIVVAILKGGAMAVRWKNGALSVRFEGNHLADYSEALSDLGFLVKKDYASVHYDVKSSSLVCKTVGAILGRIGLLNIVSTCDVLEGVCNEPDVH